jgi:hypothetical protein
MMYPRRRCVTTPATGLVLVEPREFTPEDFK